MKTLFRVLENTHTNMTQLYQLTELIKLNTMETLFIVLENTHEHDIVRIECYKFAGLRINLGSYSGLLIIFSTLLIQNGLVHVVGDHRGSDQLSHLKH